MQLNSDSFCDSVRIWMEVIGHLWAELGFWFFSEKRVKISAATNIWWARTFRQVVPVQQAGTVRQRRRPYNWAGLWADSTWGLHGREATPSERRALQPDWQGDRSWRFCRAQIVRAWTPTFAAANIFYRPRRFQRAPCYCRILWDANILYMAQTFYVCADISWAQTFHGRKHFMGANISWAQTFQWKRIFCVWIIIVGGRQYLMIFAVSLASFIFAISFAWFFAANIWVYFQYLFVHVLCANIFGANVLELM